MTVARARCRVSCRSLFWVPHRPLVGPLGPSPVPRRPLAGPLSVPGGPLSAPSWVVAGPGSRAEPVSRGRGARSLGGASDAYQSGETYHNGLTFEQFDSSLRTILPKTPPKRRRRFRVEDGPTAAVDMALRGCGACFCLCVGGSVVRSRPAWSRAACPDASVPFHGSPYASAHVCKDESRRRLFGIRVSILTSRPTAYTGERAYVAS